MKEKFRPSKVVLFVALIFFIALLLFLVFFTGDPIRQVSFLA